MRADVGPDVERFHAGLSRTVTTKAAPGYRSCCSRSVTIKCMLVNEVEAKRAGSAGTTKRSLNAGLMNVPASIQERQ
jgi:hypothetical protein